MANPFDQFDAPAASQKGKAAANPFDQFDAPKPSQTKGVLESVVSVPADLGRWIVDKAASMDWQKGMLSGAADIGNTILNAAVNGGEAIKNAVSPPSAASVVTGDNRSAAKKWNDDRNASLQSFNKSNDSPLFSSGRIVGNVAGTAGVGGALANGVRAVAGAAPATANILGPLASSIESGGFALNGSTGSTAGNLLTRAIGGAVTGGASSAMVDPKQAAVGAVIGAGLPVGVKVAGTLGNALVREVSPEVQALYQKAKTMGIDVPADRLTDSKPLNALAASLNYVPMSGRPAAEEKMVSQLNQAVSRTFGQDSDNVTAALRKASGDLGAKFDQTLSNNVVKLDNQFMSDLASHEQTAANELGADGARIIKKQIDEILEKGQSGAMDGQAAYNIKKTLDRISNRNSPEAYYARQLKQSLMDALNRSLAPADAAAFSTVRQQYGNMLALENLAQNGAEGGISIGRLANLKNINNQDLQDIADIASQFVKAREGAHGAAQRVTLGALGGAAAGTTGNVPLLVGGIAAGRAANTALNSNALKNLLINRPTMAPVNQIGANPLLRALGYESTSSNP